MYFRHISAKIQLKNLKQHFDWEGRAPSPPGYALVIKETLKLCSCVCYKSLMAV